MPKINIVAIIKAANPVLSFDALLLDGDQDTPPSDASFVYFSHIFYNKQIIIISITYVLILLYYIFFNLTMSYGTN